MKGDKLAPAGAGRAEPASLAGRPLVALVLSAAGGVGRSTVAARLAVALHRSAGPPGQRAVAVCDPGTRGGSPWPGWLDHAAERGTSWLAAASTEEFGRELRRSTSAIDVPDSRPLWVLTDTGPLAPGFAGAGLEPAAWAPVLRYVRAVVLDGDGAEGFRLARQQAGGAESTAATWLDQPGVTVAPVWVTDPSPAGLARTLAAVTAAEAAGLPMGKFVVAVNDCRGHGWLARSRSRRTLLADRVGAIVELGHDPALRRDDWPGRQVTSRDTAALVSAVLAAAGRPAPGLAPAASPAADRGGTAGAGPAARKEERISWHVSPATRALPAGR